MHENRDAWASNIGFVLAAAGSAIGLGNIWKFPGKIGANGGGTFIVVYLCIVVLIGFSIMLAEIALGRFSQSNSISAFTKINKKWSFVGMLGITAAFIILSYYSVVGGWVLKYIVTYLLGTGFTGGTEAYFVNFISQGVQPLIWHALFMSIVVFVVTRGVSAGIEKVSKVLMPVLLLILFAITVRAVTLPGAEEGIKFLFQFNVMDITPSLIISALGQAFFSLSLGMAIMITYGSYVSKEDSLTKSVAMIAGLDTCIALLAGFAIICAVFATDPTLIGSGGGGFAFISLPNIFAQMPLGDVFGFLFFVLLFFAAFTSAISILEGIVACVTEMFSIKRVKATILLGVVMYIVGCGYSLSQGALPWLKLPWFDFANGLTFQAMGNVMEYLTDNLLIPLTALFVCIFVGHIWGTTNAIEEIKVGSEFKMQKTWVFSIKYICPIAIAVILFTTLVLGTSIS
ncbi:MAG: sodium-dependent transporter [Clostridia bacterium]